METQLNLFQQKLFSLHEDATSVKKKKKSTYIRKFPVPRVLRRDIRREYPTMLALAINSHDFSHLSGFFHAISIPTCQYMDINEGAPKVNLPVSRRGYNLEELIHLIAVGLQSMPDAVFTIEKAYIVQTRDNEGSKIVIHADVKSTFFVDTELKSEGRMATNDLPFSLYTFQTKPIITLQLNENNELIYLENILAKDENAYCPMLHICN
jgi:hypothetical protein